MIRRLGVLALFLFLALVLAVLLYRTVLGRRARPNLRWWQRLVTPATAHAIRLGRAQYCRRVYARKDQVLVPAPPRTGKSGVIAGRMMSHPGAVLATSTRPDRPYPHRPAEGR